MDRNKNKPPMKKMENKFTIKTNPKIEKNRGVKQIYSQHSTNNTCRATSILSMEAKKKSSSKEVVLNKEISSKTESKPE